MSINLVTLKETAIAEIVAATGSEQLIDKATRRNFVGLYDEETNWYIPLRANLGKKKPQGAVFDTPFRTTNPHFKRPGLDFQKAIYLEKDGVLSIRNTLPKEQSEFLDTHQFEIKRAFEQYIFKVANHEMSDNQYFMSTPSLFPEGIEKIKQEVIEKENNMNRFETYKDALNAAYPDKVQEDYVIPNFERLHFLEKIKSKKFEEIFSESQSLPHFKALTQQTYTTVLENITNSQNKSLLDELSGLEQFNLADNVKKWNLKGGAPAVLDSYWNNLSNNQKIEFTQFVKWANEEKINGYYEYDYDTGQIDELPPFENEAEEKYLKLEIPEERTEQYRELWSRVNETSRDPEFRLDNTNKIDNKLQELQDAQIIDATKQAENSILQSIELQTIEFTNEYDGDEYNMGKIPWSNLELEIASIEPNSWPDDGKYFVRAALVDHQDDVLDEVILTPFIVEIPDYTKEKWFEWFDTHADKVEDIIFSSTEVKALLEELDYRKLPAEERQAILDEKNGVMNLFDEQTQDPIILGIETYEKYTVEYHPAFDSNAASVNVATSEGDITFVKDEDGELIVAASHQVDNLSNDVKRSMKEIAEFKINHPEKSMQEFSIMKLQNESKEQALHQADDGTKMFEFQFYDELIPGSYDADKHTVKINFTARDTINYQHHQFVAEVDVLSPINAKNKIKLSTARFFENNQDISKKLGVLDWTESINNFKITLPQNKEELKKEIEQAITTKISDARASDSLVEVAKISGEIDTLEGHLDEVSAQPITTSDELVQPLSLQELIAQKDLKGIEEHIKSGIGEYLDSDTFKNYLDFARQFRQYSYRNKILIKGQNPKASLVAGYRSWQEKGRQVQRGQKALKIFVPNLAAKKDKDGNYSRDKEGNIIKEVKGFYLASVYDVSQTEGEPIPKPIYELEENINSPRKFDWYIKAITELSPVPIQFSEIEGTAKGFFVPAEKQITIRPGMSQSQTIKTMLHEVTHSILHDNDVPVFGSSEYARQEIEAESVAYMVANSLGIETQDYSFGYLASWTDLGLSLENLEKSLDLICNQAQKMMGELDNILKQIPIEEQTQEVKPEQKQSNPRPKSSIKMHM